MPQNRKPLTSEQEEALKRIIESAEAVKIAEREFVQSVYDSQLMMPKLPFGRMTGVPGYSNPYSLLTLMRRSIERGELPPLTYELVARPVIQNPEGEPAEDSE